MDAAITAEIQIPNVSEFCRVNDVNRRTFYRHRQRIAAEGEWRPAGRGGSSGGGT